MFEKNKTAWDLKRLKKLTDIRNIGLYVFAVIVLAITWSGVKTVQNNYDLQKKISALQQQNAVLALQNQNAGLQNEYLSTNEYLDLAARENLGLAAPGETILVVPKSVALSYVDQSLGPTQVASASQSIDTRPTYVKNLEDWRDFLLGRKLFSD